MPSTLSKITRAPLELPWDVLLVVFQHSDDAALAVLGRVSLDFLAATSAILYRHAVVRSEGSLEGLFSERSERESTTSESRIKPFLSLSQIETLRLLLPNPYPRWLDLSTSRIDPSTIPLPLDLIHISYGYDPEHNPEDTTPRHTLVSLHTSLLPLLNPTRVVYVRHGRDPSTAWLPLGIVHRLDSWTRLEVVELSGVVPWRQMDEWGPDGELAALPPPTLARRRTIRIHFQRLVSHSDHFKDASAVMRNMNSDSSWSFFGYEGMQEGSIVLVTGSKEEATTVEMAVRSLQIARLRAIFKVEIDPEVRILEI